MISLVICEFALPKRVRESKLTVYGVLCRGHYLDKDLTGTWLWDIGETEGRSGLRHDDSFLLDGCHCCL